MALGKKYLTSVSSSVSIAGAQEHLSDRLQKEEIFKRKIPRLRSESAPESMRRHNPCSSRQEEALREVSAPGRRRRIATCKTQLIVKVNRC